MSAAEALIQLMQVPDEPALLGKRKNRYRFPGDTARKYEIKRDLAVRHLWHTLSDVRDEGQIISVRRYPL